VWIGRSTMLDLVFIGLALAFFVACLGLVAALERL
jgi:hypothetical protein